MAGVRYRINKNKVASRIINGEAVLLNLDNGFYYSLNNTGSEVWQYLQEGKSSDEIISIFERKYTRDISRLKKDIASLLADLTKEELIAK